MVNTAIEGRELGAVRFPIDRSKLAELARAFHDDDPGWHDAAASAAAGFEGVPVPPTATAIADHWRPGGAVDHAIEVGIDLERLLHGEVAWEYLRPVRLGDELTATTRVTGVTRREGRRGGAMTIVTLASEYVNQRGELALRRQDTYIETGVRA